MNPKLKILAIISMIYQSMGCQGKCTPVDFTLECPVDPGHARDALDEDGTLDASITAEICETCEGDNTSIFEITRCEGDAGPTVECLKCRFYGPCL